MPTRFWLHGILFQAACKIPRGQQVAHPTLAIKNQSVLDDLRKVERGEWKKVYRDGFDGNGNKVSIHYFQNSRTGRVFNVKVKNYWSN